MPLNDFIIIDDALLENYIDQLVAKLSHDEVHGDPEGHTPKADILASIKSMIEEARVRRPETMNELITKVDKLTAEIQPLRRKFMNAEEGYKVLRNYALKSVQELEDTQVKAINTILIGLSVSYAAFNGLDSLRRQDCSNEYGEEDDD